MSNPDTPAATYKSRPAAPPTAEESLGFLDHFRELRARLVKICIAVGLGFGLCWIFKSHLVDALFQPLLNALAATGQPANIVALGVPEKFITYMEIALMGGIFVSSPVIFYQIWAFVAPGLYDEEKTCIIPVALASAVFFVLGALFCYGVLFPNALPFLLGFGEEYMRDTPRMSEYFSFALQLLLAFGLIFELPLFVFFLARLGIVSAAALRRFRRYYIVGAFIAAAVLTPPDVMSQLIMAAPMLLLYELGIFIAMLFGRKPAKKTEEKTESPKPVHK
jgi:sec-independent protein translocase protein TatC